MSLGAGNGASAEIYPLPLAERLPAIRVPLRQSDADVSLDLQALIDQCYENGGYDTIDYRRPSNRRSTRPIWLGPRSGCGPRECDNVKYFAV